MESVDFGFAAGPGNAQQTDQDGSFTVPEAMNPYWQWLQIEGDGRTPDHYRLLGLQLFESDAERIGRAADAMLARVRRIRPGEHLNLWSRLLDEIGAAKACLLDPASKAAYDWQLRNASARASDVFLTIVKETSTSVDVDVVQPVATSGDSPDVRGAADENGTVPFGSVESPIEYSPIEVQPEPVTSARSSNSLWIPLAVGVVLLVIFLIGAVELSIRSDRSAEKSAGVQTTATETIKTERPAPQPKPFRPHPPAEKSPPAKADTPKVETALAAAPTPPPPPLKPAVAKEPPAEKNGKTDSSTSVETSPPPDPAKTEAFAKAAADARQALVERDMARAEKNLKTAAANAQTDEERDRVDRLQTMLDHLTQFWDGIRASLAKLQSMDELELNNTRIIVVESGPDSLIVKSAGRVLRYRLATLPVSIIIALANQNFAKDAGSKAIVGTFLALDPNGDRALARQYWEEAAHEGLDAKKLLQELDNEPIGPAQKNEPPADKQQIEAAEKNVRQTFEQQYAKAVNASGQAELAKLLLAKAAAADSPEIRFVMFREAQAFACKAGQPALACEAIDKMARYFNVDPLGMKTAALEEAVENSHAAPSQRDHVNLAMNLITEAVEQRRLDEAQRLADVAMDAARKSKNAALLRRVAPVAKQIQALRKPAESKP